MWKLSSPAFIALHSKSVIINSGAKCVCLCI